MTAVYDPKEFADWLSEAFRRSSFKSWRELARHIGTSVSTVTRYATAKPQSLTNKPSQPPANLVVKLAELLGEDANIGLMKAGHAPLSSNGSTTLPITKDIRIVLDRRDLSADDLEELETAVATAVAIAEKRIEDKKKQQ